MNTILEELVELKKALDSTQKCWALMRFDDNGNEFEMALFENLEAAEVARKTYEARGHKQTYFLRKR